MAQTLFGFYFADIETPDIEQDFIKVKRVYDKCLELSPKLILKLMTCVF